MASGVYTIECIANGRRYVGSAVDIEKRWREHRRQLVAGNHHSRFLMRDWRKRGPGAFRFSVLLLCDRENVLFFEQRALDAYRPEYNTARVAGSMLGYRHTEETRARLSIARRRNPSSPRKGMTHSLEARAKISASRKGKGGGPHSSERIAKAAAAMRATKSVLDENKVRRIRQLTASGVCHRQVAEEVGCSYWAVADIARLRTYAWVK